MALELFKPFIINKLIEKEHAHNVRMAGPNRLDTDTEIAYEILDDIIRKHYVLLNRAPTLHRLSIQAFQPVLIEVRRSSFIRWFATPLMRTLTGTRWRFMFR